MIRNNGDNRYPKGIFLNLKGHVVMRVVGWLSKSVSFGSKGAARGLVAMLFAATVIFGQGPVRMAHASDDPSGPLLHLKGALSQGASPTEITLNAAALAEIAPVSFTTTTIWTNGPQAFKGSSLAGLLKHFNITSGTLLARAVNDYTVAIPVSEIEEGGPMIAFEANGAAMPLRDKGPFWLVYPYDLDERYRSEKVYSRSIWQLVSIEVVP